ncbi:DNA topoisomerase III [Shewanella sp. 1_MG-2023]|uniref:DNA topoisomerase III n=1 Tax=unclassified Shewanella TaxID=196818 RepID=UPI0026E307DF|nr:MULTISPECIES: DNA topoisomerase III [unclassified Shewanella]MDO6613626.1 DNA topoisomerase III [Shewanella sp. 7_MG-2023]MDO6773403.1 DNA topoisomerase III [Shewanella sp. 2_MG-2023]MDO6796276.1 DNA topoisomerase III [Shewanella sp. 1_MG-2023]
MILYIAEKPSLGRAIADVLPKPHKKGDGYIMTANGDCVSWCVGHLLEQAEPDAYDPAYKSWQLAHLPIVPQQWKLKPKSKTRSQLSTLKKLIKQASSLVNAGDPDREGQLLVDEVISHSGIKADKISQTQRLLISDLNPSAVKRALNQMRSNKEFVPLSTSALARSRADWLYGMNMTRAYTIQGRKVGYQGVLSVGRVQTPVLGLVVRRDEEIAHFVPKPFYDVLAHLITQENQTFPAKWKPSEACQPYMDEEGRVLAKGLAENVVGRITNQPAEVTKLEAKSKRQNPPLPYSLSALQIDAAKRFGMSAKDVLDTCQSLYERHKLITYPRSDSRYLPVEQHGLAPQVINAISKNDPSLTAKADSPNSKLKSKAWDDKKVDAHHAIVPTEKVTNLANLSSKEAKLYSHIARQYLAQFYKAYLYDETQVEVTIAGGLFTTKAKQETSLGWKQLFAASDTTKKDDDELATLPALTQGQSLHCTQGELLEKVTQPPKHFTDATLLGAMTGINRFVTNKDVKKILKDTDGLGTEATRAGIIELLFKRGYLQRQGKSIVATPVGIGLVNSLPESATTPDMTALWESSLDAISQKQLRYDAFMSPLLNQLNDLITQAANQLPSALSGVTGPGYKKRRSSSSRGSSTKSSGYKRKASSSSSGNKTIKNTTKRVSKKTAN